MLVPFAFPFRTGRSRRSLGGQRDRNRDRDRDRDRAAAPNESDP